MKWAYQVKDKLKVVAVLLLIIILILANNISNRRTFSNLNESIASIYKDRLMPATYIFQLTDHLYQKRLLYDKNDPLNSLEINATPHDKAIENIIKTYEATYLTVAEKKQWGNFKRELEVYNKLYNNPAKNDKATEASFDKVLQSLNALSNIQASEGSNIFKISSINISGTIIMSQLEIALLLILGVVALILISAGDHKLLQVQNSRLN